MNSPSAMVRFEPEIDLALSESRVLVPIISRAALESDWVEREIDKRKAIFDDRHANILPIETEHRLAEKMGVGFTSIRTGPRGSAEEAAAVARDRRRQRRDERPQRDRIPQRRGSLAIRTPPG